MVQKSDGCWSWSGANNGNGYGRFYSEGTRIYAHRVAYEALVGTVPAGMELDHLCRNRGCVNPAHLEPVTHRENTLRGHTVAAVKARQTHCVHGHQFDAANTLTLHDGTRRCRPCSRRRKAAYRAARVAA